MTDKNPKPKLFITEDINDVDDEVRDNIVGCTKQLLEDTNSNSIKDLDQYLECHLVDKFPSGVDYWPLYKYKGEYYCTGLY